MKTLLCLIFSFLCFIVVPPAIVQAQPLRSLSIQGCLIDAFTGEPYQGGPYTIIITLFNDSLSNNTSDSLHSQTFEGVYVTDGIFSLVLESIPDSVAFDKQYWLGITVNGEELTPRTPLTSSPYALYAMRIDSTAAVTGLWVGSERLTGEVVLETSGGITVTRRNSNVIVVNATTGNGRISHVISSNGQITVDSSSSAVIDLGIAPDSITTDEILDGTVTEDDIGTDAVGSDEIVNRTILAEDIAPGPAHTALMTDNTDTVRWSKITSEEIQDATILAQDIKPTSLIGETNNVYLQSNGSSVFWGVPEKESILPGTILPGPMNTVLTTNAAGTLVQWDKVITDMIANFAVTTIKIDNRAVTTAKIDNLAVTNSKLSADAVTSDKILNASILEEDINPGSIHTVLITNGLGAVRWDKISSMEILNETILAEDIATGAISSDEILNFTITNEDIAANTITRDNLAPDALGSKFSKAIDFPLVGACDFIDSTVVASGAQPSDLVVLGIPNSAMLQGTTKIDVIYMAWVSAPDVVTIRCKNGSMTTAVNPENGGFNFMVIPCP